MVTSRDRFDGFYDLIKPMIFEVTAWNPEIAHYLFVSSLKVMDKLGCAEAILDNSANRMNPGYDIANAAGFNKNGEINPRLMRLLGFDRVVVGTVTGNRCKGNDKPRLRRFPGVGSLVNYLGVPNIGAERVARKLKGYGDHGVPLTVSLMATPGKKGYDVFRDLDYTVSVMRDVSYVDRFELNISCPNIYQSMRVGTRIDNLAMLDEMVATIVNKKRPGQSLYLKGSPDSSEDDVDDVVSVGDRYDVRGYTTTNSTKEHNFVCVGGASGNAVWDASVRTQKYFTDRVGDGIELIACGGINSAYRARARCSIGNCKEIQIFTGLVFKGTRLLRELRAA